MDSKTIDFINYHAASYVNEFMSGDSTIRARMQEILTDFGKQLIDCYPREGKETPDELSNCNKPVVISSVYVIQHKYNLLIHGCFISKKKAEKYINGNDDYAIIRLAVE